MSNKPPVRLVKPDPSDRNDPLNAALSTPEMETSAMHPLEVWLDREFLIHTIQESIRLIKERAEGNTDFEYRRYVKALLQQRADFVENLQRDSTPMVYIALYRADEDIKSDELTLADVEELPPGDDDLVF